MTAAIRIGLLAAESRREADGIRDYTIGLQHALDAAGVEATLLLWRGGEWTDGKRSIIALDHFDAVLLQYNPFSFGRRGFAPKLPLALHRMRRKRGRPLMAIMAHEVFVPMKNVRWALMGAWQRLQLIGLQQACDVQFCAVERWAQYLGRTAPGRPVHHLPVASNIPDARSERVATRAELGVGPGAIVLSCLGLRHPGRLTEHVLEAVTRLGERGREVLLVDIGTGDRGRTEIGTGVTVISTGFLDEWEFARRVAASDIFLAPYADGVSTRRTTVMSALQHGVALAGTEGHLTDSELRRSRALTLTPVHDARGFADAIVGLAEDESLRLERGRLGRELYETSFDWPVLVQRLLSSLRR